VNSGIDPLILKFRHLKEPRKQAQCGINFQLNSEIKYRFFSRMWKPKYPWNHVQLLLEFMLSFYVHFFNIADYLYWRI